MQLTISKLQEELSLYRNGTTAEQFMELLAEKDQEVASLRCNVDKLQDKLTRVVKGVKDSLIEKDAIAKQNLILQSNMSSLRQENEKLRTIINATTTSTTTSTATNNVSNNNNNNDNNNNNATDDDRIEKYEQDLADHYQSIERLQVRCASLVCEKSSLSKTLEKERNERTKEIAEYKDELNRAIYYNNEIKERLTDEHGQNIALTTELRNIKRKLYEATNRTNRTNRKDVDHDIDHQNGIENKENIAKNTLGSRNTSNTFIL